MQTAIDALSIFRQRMNGANRIEGKNTPLLIAVEGDGELFMHIAFKDAAEETLKSAIILKNDFFPSH